MIKNLAIAGLLALTAGQAFAGVIKSYDQKHDCDLYRVQNKVKNKSGEYVYPELKDGELIVSEIEAYNMKLHNIKLSPESSELVGNLRLNKILGRNKDLKKQVSIKFDNKHANNLLNFYFNEVCIDNDQQIVFANKYGKKDF